MLPWQQSMLDQWDHYSVDQPFALKCKALVLAIGIYALVCLLFFIPHFQNAKPTTVFIHGATAPVLFMGTGTGNGNGSARLQRKKSKKAELKKSEEKKQPQKKETVVAQKPEPKKVELPARKSVVKEPKKKSKQELLAEKKKAQAEAAKAKKAQAAAQKAAADKAAKEKLERQKAEREKKTLKSLEAEKKAQEQKENEKKVPEKVEKEVVSAQIKADNNSAVSNELQDIIIGQAYGEGANEGSASEGGQGYDPALKSHMALARAVTRVWRPPQVKITSPVRAVAQVDATGKVKDVQLETKSGVVAYDIAARAAVLRTEFPKEFWGKPVALVFGA